MYSVMIPNYYPTDPLPSLTEISANMMDDNDMEELVNNTSKHMEMIASVRTENKRK